MYPVLGTHHPALDVIIYPYIARERKLYMALALVFFTAIAAHGILGPIIHANFWRDIVAENDVQADGYYGSDDMDGSEIDLSFLDENEDDGKK